MTMTVSRIRDELADREAIRDCLYRYSRGVDRSDAELIRSAYWPGAMDYHTGFTGTIEQFIDWALPRLRLLEQGIHLIGNVLIRIDGDQASVESYFWSVSVVPGDAPRQYVVAGRYVDRFEKREDEWRIAERHVVHDWYDEGPTTSDWARGPFDMGPILRGARAPDDTSCGLPGF
jgi:hypothetical protein